MKPIKETHPSLNNHCLEYSFNRGTVLDINTGNEFDINQEIPVFTSFEIQKHTVDKVVLKEFLLNELVSHGPCDENYVNYLMDKLDK